MPFVVLAAVIAMPSATETPSGSVMPPMRVETSDPTTPEGTAESSVADRERVVSARTGASLTPVITTVLVWLANPPIFPELSVTVIVGLLARAGSSLVLENVTALNSAPRFSLINGWPKNPPPVKTTVANPFELLYVTEYVRPVTPVASEVTGVVSETVVRLKLDILVPVKSS